MEENKQMPESEDVIEENASAETETPVEPTQTADPIENASPEEEEKLSGKDKKKMKKAEAEIARLEKELSTKEAALTEAKDQYLRVLAEYDNFRKRSVKEKEGIYTDAYVDALTQLLPVLDNMDRAAAYGAEDPESPMAKGVELTRKSFVEALAKMGVAEIEALGCPFDPNLHNAVMHEENEEVGENTITEVFMKGYIKGDKVLRHSMVKVAN